MTIEIGELRTEFRLSNFTNIGLGIGVFFTFVAVYAFYTLIYDAFFHPLKHIPGPFFAKFSGIPYVMHMRDGSITTWIKKLHDKYGDAVRLAPNEVSFISGETAWPDIYGFRIGKYKNTGYYLKDRTWYPVPVNGVRSIIGADEEDHSRMRRNLSHAFSDKALREQEPAIQTYVDLLVSRLGDHAAEGKTVDIMRWYNYTTFDIISDLAFGEPLYCLRDSSYHNWVHMVLGFVKSFGFVSINKKYPLFGLHDTITSFFQNKSTALKMRTDFSNLARDKVERRLAKISSGDDSPKTDFWAHIIANQEKEGRRLERAEMHSNAITLLVAGSETTATTLSGTTFLLLRNPSTYQKLTTEIRSSFSSQSEITIEAVNKLPYLITVLQEALRVYPPVPTGFPRTVPAGGDTISGVYVPGGTAVYVSQHAAHHSERNFKESERFVPERWMDGSAGEEWKGDKREVVQPFSYGPRACLGKNLAFAEMRLILAKLLFSFDLELVDKERDWMGEQKVFTLWQKPPLEVKLTPVEG